jgi:hypothetical protein
MLSTGYTRNVLLAVGHSVAARHWIRVARDWPGTENVRYKKHDIIEIDIHGAIAVSRNVRCRLTACTEYVRYKVNCVIEVNKTGSVSITANVLSQAIGDCVVCEATLALIAFVRAARIDYPGYVHIIARFMTLQIIDYIASEVIRSEENTPRKSPVEQQPAIIDLLTRDNALNCNQHN